MNERVRPGQTLEIPAETWNSLIEAKDFVFKYRGVIQALAKLKLPNAPIPTDVITVKNITGEDRDAGEVLEIGEVLFDRMERVEIGFNADTVSHNGGRSYCILAKPIPCGDDDPVADGKIGPAHISGVCVAKVDIQATTDRYAYVVNSSHNLKSGEAGQFKLLGPVTDTGVQLVAVSFADDDGRIKFGKLLEEMTEGGTSTVALCEWNGSAWQTTGISVEAIDYFLGPGESWEISTRVAIKWEYNAWVVIQAACSPDSGGGGGGGGGGAASQSPATLGAGVDADLQGTYYPGGMDYGQAYDPFSEPNDYGTFLGV